MATHATGRSASLPAASASKIRYNSGRSDMSATYIDAERPGVDSNPPESSRVLETLLDRVAKTGPASVERSHHVIIATPRPPFAPLRPPPLE